MKRVNGQSGSGLDAAALNSLCQSASALLERNHLEKLMLGDFRFSSRLKKREIRDPGLLQRLTDMAREVTDSLELPPLREVTLKILPKNSQGGKAFGTYESAFKRINFFIKEDSFPEHIEAALCHECTHYFMDVRGLDDWRDRLTNERRTDVMACLIGFSRIMIKGYMIMTHARYRVISWETDSMRVGYLDAVDCEQVRKYLLARRPQIQSKQQAQANADRMKLDLARNIAGAKAMLEQIEILYASHGAPKPGRMSGRDLARLQRALLSLETGDLRRRLTQCEAQTGGDANARLKAVNELCGEISILHAAFR